MVVVEEIRLVGTWQQKTGSARDFVSSQVKSEEMCQFNRGFVTEKYLLFFATHKKRETSLF